MGRMLRTAPACLFFLEVKMARCATIFQFMGYNQWIGWMVKVLERTQLEN
jgi:hypothetical protein